MRTLRRLWAWYCRGEAQASLRRARNYPVRNHHEGRLWAEASLWEARSREADKKLEEMTSGKSRSGV